MRERDGVVIGPRKFTAWCEDEDESGAVEYEDILGPEYAAELHAEHAYYGGESFKEIVVFVRVDADTVHKYTVAVDFNPTFTAIDEGVEP